MMDSAVLPGYLVAILLIAIAPGPDMAYIVAAAAAHGPRAGVLSAIGMALGMVAHVMAATLGLAVLISNVTWALDAIRLAGAGFLAWLAISTFRSARHAGLPERVAPTGRQVLRRAILTNLANPKVILFFAAFLPQFVRPGHGPVTIQLLSLGLIFLLVGLLIDSVIGITAGRIRTALAAGAKASTALSTIAALTFAVLAALLLIEVISP
ncbi:LysE family translocator [Streptomyces sp. 900116325]